MQRAPKVLPKQDHKWAEGETSTKSLNSVVITCTKMRVEEGTKRQYYKPHKKNYCILSCYLQTARLKNSISFYWR